MKHRISRRWTVAFALVGLLSLVLSGAAIAAEFGSGDIYRLALGERVNDDLYVSAGEIFIDGVVDGDLYAAGGYIEVNGEVTGDVVLAGGGVVIRGVVGDDARLAGAGITILGTIEDDLFMAGGGAGPGGFAFPMQMGSRSIEQGVRLGSSAQVGGDVVVAAGEGNLNGAIGGDLFVGMGTVSLGARVGGDAEIFAEQFSTTDSAVIAGQLTYSTPNRVDGVNQVADDVQYQQPVQPEASPNVIVGLLGWLLRTVGILIGFGLLGWLLLRFVPNSLTRTADVIDDEPVSAGLYGLVGAALLIFIPIVSAVLVFVAWLFWGWFWGMVVFVFLFGTLALLWMFSPLATGLWLGRRIVRQSDQSVSLLVAMLVGVLIIVVLGRLPVLGWLVYLLSFVFALGGLIRLAQGTHKPAESAPTATIGQV
ncbi:hypothetical protein GC175_20600 [bacterium]|nr:hypothetical protein [bacterium]